MLGENHLLTHEFPEFLDSILYLKAHDADFSALAKRYHKLDHQIRGLEKNEVPITDEHFVELKSQRVDLKEQLYHRLMVHSN